MTTSETPATQEPTTVDKLRGLPWSIAGDTANTVFAQWIFFGSVFILFLDKLGLNKTQIGSLALIHSLCRFGCALHRAGRGTLWHQTYLCHLLWHSQSDHCRALVDAVGHLGLRAYRCHDLCRGDHGRLCADQGGGRHGCLSLGARIYSRQRARQVLRHQQSLSPRSPPLPPLPSLAS